MLFSAFNKSLRGTKGSSKLSQKKTRVYGKNVQKGVFSVLGQKRNLNLHESDSKILLNKYGARTQRFVVSESADKAEAQAKQLNAKEYVVKSQILAGGRGKGSFLENGFKGGVHVVKTPEEVKNVSKNMIGYHLRTKQTSEAGVLVKNVMIAESIDLMREVYFAILMDRDTNGPVLVGSPKGGMDIEQVAEEDPDAIFTESVDIDKGPQEEVLIKMAKNLDFKTKDLQEQAAKQMKALYKLFIDLDATQVEINPLAETSDAQVYCVDAKLNFDDNAAFRHKDIYALRDITEEDPREVKADSVGLNYIGLDGNIGCMVNGAGLAMATMDIVKLYNGEPANFLDVGGGANENQITEAFKIIVGDPRVKCILVNIFGGIMRCDIIASGIVKAATEIGLKLPLVVRLKGTNVEKGKKILEQSDVNIITADDLDDAAQRAVKAMNEEKH